MLLRSVGYSDARRELRDRQWARFGAFLTCNPCETGYVAAVSLALRVPLGASVFCGTSAPPPTFPMEGR